MLLDATTLSDLRFVGLFLVGSGFVFVLSVILYRLTAHPLAKYPGPPLGRITGWYSVWHAYTGKRHIDFEALHARYGEIVRYGPNALSYNRADALQGIYGFKSNVQKAHFYSAFPAAKGAWSTHSAIDRALHARKRRVLSQAFSDNAVRGLTPHILGVIRIFTDAIGDGGRPAQGSDEKSKGWSTPKDMAEWANYMSYDVLGDICYGQSFDTLERPDNRFAMHMVAQSSRFHYLNAQMPLLKKVGLDRVLFRDLRERRTRFMAYSRARLQQRIKVGTDNDRRDFFYYLLNAKDPETGVGFPMQELWGESNVLLIAGSDTTSTAFSATFFYLLHHPIYLNILTRQIREIFGALEEIVPGAKLNSMRFLRACVDESMRLSPPVPALLPREVLRGGMEIAGQHVPAGTVVGVPTYTLHRNATYFPAPLEYHPERWLVDEELQGNALVKHEDPKGDHARAVKTMQSAFAPFSIGSRGCIGKGIAHLEISVALARTLWLYDMRFAEGFENRGASSEGLYGLRDIFVAEKEGPVVQFRRRAES